MDSGTVMIAGSTQAVHSLLPDRSSGHRAPPVNPGPDATAICIAVANAGQGEVEPNGRSDRSSAPQANSIGGNAWISAPTVQARDVHGGVHLHGAPAPPPPAPRQLPPVTGHFTSRKRDMDRLDGLLADWTRDTPLLVVLSGQAGIGKTALAGRWLRAVEQGFPDGQFYADLRGHSEATSAGPGEVLARFLRAIGIDSAPADLDERASLWRSATAGMHMMVLLDNAFSAAQVRALLPGSPYALVVATGRRRLSGLGIDGAAFHQLKALDIKAGLELLARGIGKGRVGAELQAAEELVARCAGLPLAVSLATARLATRPRQSLRSLADLLSRDSGRLAALELEGETAVRNALDASYADLSRDGARLYRALGCLPLLSFDSRIAAAAGRLPPGRAESALDELTEANLVEDLGPDTCRFHDLVRDHARALALQQDPLHERTVALRAACDVFLVAATAAQRRLTPAQYGLPRDYREPVPEAPSFDDDATALGWLADQQDNLMALVRTAAEQGLDGSVWQIVDAMWPLFLRLHRYDVWIEAHRIGRAAAERSADPRALRQMLNSGAIGLTSAGRLDEAVEWYTRSAREARSAGDPRDEGQALLGIGTCYRRAGRPEQALPVLREAIGLWEDCGYRRGVALSRIVLGEISLEAGTSDAESHFAPAHATLVEVDDLYDATRALAFLGCALARKGDVAEGLTRLRTAVAAFRASGADLWEARALVMLGEETGRAGDRREAADSWERAATLYDSIDSAEACRLRQRLADFRDAPDRQK